MTPTLYPSLRPSDTPSSAPTTSSSINPTRERTRVPLAPLENLSQSVVNLQPFELTFKNLNSAQSPQSLARVVKIIENSILETFDSLLTIPMNIKLALATETISDLIRNIPNTVNDSAHEEFTLTIQFNVQVLVHNQKQDDASGDGSYAMRTSMNSMFSAFTYDAAIAYLFLDSNEMVNLIEKIKQESIDEFGNFDTFEYTNEVILLPWSRSENSVEAFEILPGSKVFTVASTVVALAVFLSVGIIAVKLRQQTKTKKNNSNKYIEKDTTVSSSTTDTLNECVSELPEESSKKKINKKETDIKNKSATKKEISNNKNSVKITSKSKLQKQISHSSIESIQNTNSVSDERLKKLDEELSDPYKIYLNGKSPGRRDKLYLTVLQTLPEERFKPYPNLESWLERCTMYDNKPAWMNV
eukprot:CAMPEP_0194294586 /NCGR_PEP_ID=MMETSP0169-20130528/51067_1 /TAXON_ID=218684 /ORGANISM="Corethron pennatum, Strain L29A3" /LENGTH=413 /DNA_ID=CAMNT_0039043491 /DNA_START=176 /DNA_END=1417 /DNA_ORIENTATION=-